MVSAAGLPGLLDAIYDAAVEASRWPAALDRISAHFSANASGIVVLDRRTPQALLAATDSYYPAEVLAQYVAYFAARDLLRIAASGRQEEVLTDEALRTSEILRSEAYNDFYLAQDLVHYAGYSWGASEGQDASFVLYRPASSRGFDDEDLRELAILIPHIRRAANISGRLRTSRLETASLHHAIDQFRIAVVLLDLQGRVVRMNRLAEEILSRSDGLDARGGKLHVWREPEHSELQRQIAFAASRDELEAVPHVLVPRPSGKPPLELIAIPYAPRTEAAGVLIMMSDPASKRLDAAGTLQKRFGLTRTEAEIALRIAAGISPGRIAEERCNSIHTVRSHVKRILQKASARSQPDLVRMILTHSG